MQASNGPMSSTSPVQPPSVTATQATLPAPHSHKRSAGMALRFQHLTQHAPRERKRSHKHEPKSKPACVTSRSSSDPTPRPKAFSDRKSTRLNSSHVATSYAVFCLK